MKTTLCKGDLVRFYHRERRFCNGTVLKINSDESIIMIDELGETQKCWSDCVVSVMSANDINEMILI